MMLKIKEGFQEKELEVRKINDLIQSNVHVEIIDNYSKHIMQSNPNGNAKIKSVSK